MLVHGQSSPILRTRQQQGRWRSASHSRRARRQGMLVPAAKDTSFEGSLLDLQQTIIQEAEASSGGSHTFLQDAWSRPPGSGPSCGHGITAVLEGNPLLEKAAVNTSILEGVLSPQRAQAMSARGRGISAAGGQRYTAAALSLVFHPGHPFVPTLRADIRCFQVDGHTWYGGGCDLTPAYLYEEDAQSFHAFWRDACDRWQPGLYARLKHDCDEYFWLPARREHRGIGGIFFDDMDAESLPDVQQFVQDVGKGILPSWRGIAAQRSSEVFEPQHRQWQLQRRARYIEFNLLYDRGVRFGLDSGRIESVMVSAPPLVAWNYNVQPKDGSREHQLLQALQSPRDWA